jgi:hypothetical protein
MKLNEILVLRVLIPEHIASHHITSLTFPETSDQIDSETSPGGEVRSGDVM